ncbi:MAG: hypothetical protein H6564_09010 [Lewinellaceae bacterium]|nr:hypothetical protein [Lewinellaceae bacterium]
MHYQRNALTRFAGVHALLLILALYLPASAQKAATLQFSVDMNPVIAQVKNLSSVGVRGNLPPLSWEASIPMQDEDGDGIYTATVTFPEARANAALEYKYIYDDQHWELPSQNRIRFLANDKQDKAVSLWDTPSLLSPALLPKITARQLLDDLEIAQKAFLELHPGLYRYNTAEQVEALFEVCRQKCSAGLSYSEAYLAFSELLASFRCGHTYANFFNQPAFIQQALFLQADKLPFTFRIIDGRMLVGHNASEDQRICKGCEVLAVNGIPMHDILDRLAQLVPADGDNLAKRMARLELHDFEAFAAFDVFFPLLYPPSGGKYMLSMRKLDTGEQFDCELEAMSSAERDAKNRDRFQLNEPSYDSEWAFSILDEKTGYLRLGHFETWKMTMDWKAFLKRAFQALESKKAGHLIIDIRGNEGGADEVILELTRYLARKPVSAPPMRSLTRYAVLPLELRPYLSSWDDSFKDMSREVTKAEGGYYAFRPGKTVRLPGSKKAYPGKVYLLVGAANSSATFNMAKIWKENKLATLIGQTTGGSRQGINGGRIAFLHLPNTGIELDLPLIGSFPLEPQPAGGIEPDIYVQPNIGDFLNGTDTELETAKALIREQIE